MTGGIYLHVLSFAVANWKCLCSFIAGDLRRLPYINSFQGFSAYGSWDRLLRRYSNPEGRRGEPAEGGGTTRRGHLVLSRIEWVNCRNGLVFYYFGNFVTYAGQWAVRDRKDLDMWGRSGAISCSSSKGFARATGVETSYKGAIRAWRVRARGLD